VPDAYGRRPVIEGANAVTAPGLDYRSEERGIIKIGSSNIPADTTPRHIIVENLEIRNARQGVSFRTCSGATGSYSVNAAAIYLEKGEFITLRNNVLHTSGNGLFVASSVAAPTRDILIQGNYIHSNGYANNTQQHNSYTEAVRITFEGNRFGPLTPGSHGNNIKDRSAGTVVRYNWIEGGNRQLDLVDAASNSTIYTDPSYSQTFVYGNVLVEPANDGNRQIIHYGGDSSDVNAYRRGTLYLYNNTLVSTRTDRTVVVRLSTNSERCDARNNILYVTAAGNTLALTEGTGTFEFRHNWLKPGWVRTFSPLTGVVADLGGNITGATPGFLNEPAKDYRLGSVSAAADAGTILHPNASATGALALQYLQHQRTESRKQDLTIDMGAFER
jgi:hypothetical protein